MPGRALSLQAVKSLHTLIWAFFAGCILAIPVATLCGAYRVAVGLVAVVFVEVLVLLFNKWSCPLTGVAARYTEDRRENFDIYLPRLLAKYNKHVFGTLYAAGALYALLAWANAKAAPRASEEAAMFSHVTVGTHDLDRASAFYDATLASLRIIRVPGKYANWSARSRSGEPTRSWVGLPFNQLPASWGTARRSRSPRVRGARSMPRTAAAADDWDGE